MHILPAPALDSTFDLERAAELQLAADSAADQVALEQLADAAPAAAGIEDEPDVAGGEKALGGAAVTWDIDVATFGQHDRVRYYLDFFRNTGRERMNIWLGRLPRYEAMIRQRLQDEGMPGDLVYLALIESGMSNSAVSRAKATGMWQFMKGTARYYGLRVDSWVDERRDPYKATDAAVRHLHDLQERFGSLYLAAAAYNAGAGKVSRSLVRLPEDEADSVNSDATFFRLYDTKYLRRETKDYVPKLIAAALIAKEPDRYGFEPALSLALAASDSIVVSDMTGLDVIARLAETTVATIRELNPQYLRLSTPPGARMVVRVPAGRGESTAQAYATLPPSRRVTFLTHLVRRGETVSGIAARYGVSSASVLEANPRISARRVRAGQNLVIPTGGVMSTRVARRVAEPVEEPEFHKVRRGEALSLIADRYDVSVRQLRQWNALGSSSRIGAGMRLRVTAPNRRAGQAQPIATGASAPSDAAMKMHRVRRGETLSGLAQRYGVTVESLRDANDLPITGTIKAGTSLKIPA